MTIHYGLTGPEDAGAYQPITERFDRGPGQRCRPLLNRRPTYFSALRMLCCLAPAILLAVPARGADANSCPLVNVMAEYREALDHSRAESPAGQIAHLHREFTSAHAALYRSEVLGFGSPAALDEHIRVALPDLRRRADAIDQTAATLLTRIPRAISAFRATLPDFNCNFNIYLMPSFGLLDGAARIVDGKPALVLGVDVIAAHWKPEQLDVLIDHELFHRYHFQVAGFSDDDNDRALIWKALWAEGLATYVSAVLNPQRPLADALIVPRDLEPRAKERLRDIAAALRSNLDRVEPDVFGEYFLYGNHIAHDNGLPYRSGYYVGYRVAQKLGEHRTLFALAHLQGDDLRAQISEALNELADSPVVSYRR
jgi:hypothetical protein